MPLITIDGNIGAGKTTVLKFLHTKHGWPVDLEPVHRWMPYLQSMYQPGSKPNQLSHTAFEFQVRVWLDRCWIQPKSASSKIMLMERSPFFQQMVFVNANVANGSIRPSEHHTLIEMYTKAMEMWSPLLYIYLRSNPERCKERIAKRARPSEQFINAGYLHTLHNLHESAYLEAARRGMRIIVIDVEGKTPEMVTDEVHGILTSWYIQPKPLNPFANAFMPSCA